MEPSQRRVQVAENVADPDVMQQYVDYMVLDPSQSSVRMQTPLIDPYTYRQVGQGLQVVHLPKHAPLRHFLLHNVL